MAVADELQKAQRTTFRYIISPAPWGDWVNPSKRGGMDGVLQGLAELLRGISRGRSPREIPWNKLCMKHREYNGLSLLLLERQITLYSLWWKKLLVMFELKLGVRTEGNWEVKL